ncbi:hypothetical protein [Paracraurococcus ruber]|uniref:Uncharacterized protein n=1 Tax=Paracraurococcus ruber TaxID=77675 RepID=A0ABS1D2D1_9PROT|nr:hypothetical protein [Paracraurococcus ruber]MBK1660064.1 hypothetical protein [Paracraurococcus ruber]TDG16699.1 hypothetical protein E2C05_28990 [Paracraurococcus ruber]
MVTVAVAPAPSLPLLLAAPGTGDMDDVTLRISGGKPLQMRAALLAAGSGWSPRLAAWHEVAVYRRDGGDVAVAVTALQKAPGDAASHRAELFPTLDDAAQWLEEIDPLADLPVDLDPSDPRLSGAELALRAAALRLRADAVGRAWRALIGDLLYRLHTGT